MVGRAVTPEKTEHDQTENEREARAKKQHRECRHHV